MVRNIAAIVGAVCSIILASVGIAILRENKTRLSQGEAILNLVFMAAILGAIMWLSKRVRWGKPKEEDLHKEQPKPVSSKPCPMCGEGIIVGATRCWAKGCTYVVTETSPLR
jgi:predicted transporter